MNSWAHQRDHAYCVAEAPALARQVLVPPFRYCIHGNALMWPSPEASCLVKTQDTAIGSHSVFPPPSTLASLHVLSHAPPTQQHELGAHTLMQMRM